MTEHIKPLADRLVAVHEEQPSQTTGGLYIPESAQEKPDVAKVTSVGPNVKEIKVGDRIVYKNYATTSVTIDKIDYLIIKEEDVLATVK